MKQVRNGCRYLLALALIVFGLDKFFHYLEQPAPPADGGAFLGALTDAGYIFPAIGVVFLVAAACLVLRRVVLAVLLLAPITLNILLYHWRFDMGTIAPGAVLAALQLALAWFYCGDFTRLLRGAESE